MIKDAKISDCGRYRYWLMRQWDPKLPRMGVLMLNPSTADSEKDDPTISNTIKLAKREKCGSILVQNVFGWRSSDPEHLSDRSIDPIGPDNDFYLRDLARCHVVVVGWGDWGARFAPRIKQVDHLIRHVGVVPLCLGTTKSGHPLHLLMRFKGSPDAWPPLSIWRAPWN